MPTHPLFTLDEVELRGWFHPGALASGRALLEQGRVGALDWTTTGTESRAVAVVRSLGREIHAAVVVDQAGYEEFLDFVCVVHGVQAECDHAAAVALAVVARAGGAHMAQAPAWQHSLDRALGVPPRRGSGAGPSASSSSAELPEPAAILFEYRRPDDWAPSPALCIRPSVRGSRGMWIRDKIEWRALDRRPLIPEHRRVLAEIAAWYESREAFAAVEPSRPDRHDDRYSGYSRYGYYGAYGQLPQWLPLDQLPGRVALQLLRAAQRAGVSLVSGDRPQTPVRFAERTLAASVDARVIGDRLVLTPSMALTGIDDAPGEVGENPGLVAPDDAYLEADALSGSDPLVGAEAAGAEVAPIGDPIAGFATIASPRPKSYEISLFALDRPLDPAFAAMRDLGAIEVPLPSLGDFEREYLERLRVVAPVRSGDESYTPPPPVEPELVLHVTDEHPQLRLRWRWEYGDRVGAERPDAESAIISQVLDTVGDRGPLIGPVSSDGRNLPDRLLGRAHAIECVAEVLPALRGLDGVRIELDEAVPEYRFADELPVVEVATRADGTDWFELDVEVSVAGELAPFAELFIALSEEHPYFVMPSGVVLPLDLDELRQLRALIEESRALGEGHTRGLRVSRYQVDFWQQLVELGIVRAQADAWFDRVRELSGDEALTRVDPPAGLCAELREYQLAGFAWLDFLHRNGLGGILADDMGLGKTVQVLAMMLAAREAGRTGGRPYLVVAPTSVVGNWAAEAAKFTPGLRVVELTATTRSRGQTVAAAIAEADLVVTSYAILRLDGDEFAAERFAGLVLDEAQLVKNSKSKTFQTAKRIEADSTFVVTGTPIENDLGELWALATLACPGLLGGPSRFGEYYRRPIEREQNAERLARLRQRLRPFLLRRTKDAVAADLPAKTEQVLRVELDPAHRRAYDLRLQRERQKVLGLLDDVETNRFQIFQSLTRLRRLALDPSFDVDAEFSYVDGEIVGDGDSRPHDPSASQSGTPSAKLRLLAEIVEEVVAEGHKVLVFSQFTGFLRRARDVVAGISSEIGTAYLDGGTDARRRKNEIARFTGGEASVFFISLKAGGFGLNLTEADYCILLDPWWNPAAEAQAVDRAHRIGQTRPVMVYRLIAERTIEAKVLEKQDAKRTLYDAVLSDAGQLGTITADDIRSLIE